LREWFCSGLPEAIDKFLDPVPAFHSCIGSGDQSNKWSFLQSHWPGLIARRTIGSIGWMTQLQRLDAWDLPLNARFSTSHKLVGQNIRRSALHWPGIYTVTFQRVHLFSSASSVEALNRAINLAWRDAGDNISVRLSPDGNEPATHFGGSGAIEDWRIAELPRLFAQFRGGFAFLASDLDAPIEATINFPFDSKVSSLRGFWQCCEHLGLRRVIRPDELALGASTSTLMLQSIVNQHGAVPDGYIVECLALPWLAIVAEIDRNPAFLTEFAMHHRKFEEFLAASYERAGFDVVLTPQRGDRGRDVIATMRGLCSIRILDQAKAYKAGHLVTHDDVRAMLGTLATDSNASKGVITTTSDFQPGILKGDEFKHFLPYRLELKNGMQLAQWIKDIRVMPGAMRYG